MKRKMTWRSFLLTLMGVGYLAVTVCILVTFSALSKVELAIEKTFIAPGVLASAPRLRTTTSVRTDVIFHTGNPVGLIPRDDGSLLVADRYNKMVWKLNIGELPEPFTGRHDLVGVDGIPVGGYHDDNLEESAYLSPWGIVEFQGGYLLSDPDNNVIRYFDDDAVETAVGSGEAGFKNGYSLDTQFNRPTGIAADPSGNVYIADTGNHVIRRMDANGNVVTYAGIGEGCADGTRQTAMFRSPTGLFWHGNALYVADSGNHRVVKIEGNAVTVIAGPRENPAAPEETFEHGGYEDGDIEQAMFSNPQGIAVAQTGDVYVADTGNHAVRRISDGEVSTVRVLNADKKEVYPISPVQMIVDGDMLYVSDEFAGVIFRVPVVRRSR